MERSKESALLALPDSVGVEVGRIEGAPPELEERLRQELEGALQRRGLPASRRGNLLSYRLAGRVGSAAAAGGHGPARIDWALHAWDGRLAARFEQRVGGGGAHELTTRLEELADGIARQVRADPPVEGAPVRLMISVAPMSGVSAEAAAPLVRALEAALSSGGLDVVPPAAPSHIHVFGDAQAGPVQAGLRELRLAWSVVWSDGQELGRVDQANAVPAEWLEGAWTSIAAAAAEGTAEGVFELVFKAQQELRPTGGEGERTLR